MKTKLTQYLMAVLLGVALTTTLHAQSTAFAYQGSLTENGAPAKGAHDFEFKIYNTATFLLLDRNHPSKPLLEAVCKLSHGR